MSDSAPLRCYLVDLAIPREEWLRYYRGGANAVVARARSGERLQFPARLARPLVGADGVSGTLELWVDAGGRLQRCEARGGPGGRR